MSLNATNLFIQSSPLPATFMGTPNDLFTEMIKRMRILSPSGTNFIFIGDTEPSSNVGPWLKNGTQWWVWDPGTKKYVPVDITASFTPAFSVGHSQPTTTNPPVWLQTTSDPTSTNPLGFGEMIRLFMFDGVRWLSPHPVPPNSPECRIWTGTEAELWAYDGGDGSDPAISPPTDYTGAMWQVETLFSFRTPMGVGQNGVSYDGNGATSITIRQKLGVERVNLSQSELTEHQHFVVNDDAVAIPGTGTPITNATSVEKVGDVNGGALYILDGTTTPATLGLSSKTGGGLSHDNLMPCVGVFFIKRTVRRYYTP